MPKSYSPEFRRRVSSCIGRVGASRVMSPKSLVSPKPRSIALSPKTKSTSVDAESETLFLFRFVLYWGQSRSNAEQAQSAESDTWGNLVAGGEAE